MRAAVAATKTKPAALHGRGAGFSAVRTAPREKRSEQRSRLIGPYPPGDLETVIEPGILRNVVQRLDGARFRVGGSVHETFRAGKHDGAGTHGTRYQRDVDRARHEVAIPDGNGGGAKREDFGVPGGVGVALARVRRCGDDGAVPGDDAPDGHVTVVTRDPRLLQSKRHR